MLVKDTIISDGPQVLERVIREDPEKVVKVFEIIVQTQDPDWNDMLVVKNKGHWKRECLGGKEQVRAAGPWTLPRAPDPEVRCVMRTKGVIPN